MKRLGLDVTIWKHENCVQYDIYYSNTWKIKKWTLKGLWHASAHVRQLDFFSGEQFFKIGVLVKKSSSIDPETPDKAIISVFKSYLVHLGSFKRYILYFCASIVEKIRSHLG